MKKNGGHNVNVTITEVMLIISLIALVVLVIFLIKLIGSIQETLKQVQLLLGATQKQLNDLGSEPKNILCQANEISKNLLEKIRSLDPWFHILSEVGEDLEHKVHRWNRKIPCRTFCDQEPNLEVSDLLECVLSIVKVWKKSKVVGR